MLVCPQCQFENPNTNKFCQECGTSLGHNTCPECNSLVPFDQVNCVTCGAITGVTWWAVIYNGQSHKGQKSFHFSPTSDRAPISLDDQNRYRLLETPVSAGPSDPAAYAKVLDCQPFQPPFLETLLQPVTQVLPADSLMGSSVATDISSVEAKPQLSANTTTQIAALPPIVQPYLILQQQFCHALPLVHDAWVQNGQQFLLLEDRTHLPRLLDLLAEEERNIPQLQLLHWLYEMADLWNTLETINACQSLLEPGNLRVDEDQAICLQRLSFSPNPASTSMRDLGRLWQFLFAQSQRTQFGTVFSLLTDLETGKLTTIAELQNQIETIAQELQANQPIDEMIDSTPFDSDFPASPPTSSSPSNESLGSVDRNIPIASTRLELAGDDLPTRGEAEGEPESDDLPTVVLPMQLFNLEDVGRTDIGRQRDHNEDYFGIETQVNRLESPSGKTLHVRNLYILCDGMGGHAGGEVASALAVDTLRQYFKERWLNSSMPDGSGSLPGVDTLTEAVQLANKAIYDVNQQNARSGSGRMGTTLVMALIQDTELAIVHVGDSRLYRYTRKRGLEQLTVDHEVGQREIQRGVDPEIAYARPDAYQLTQALGPRDEHFIKPDIQYVELNEDALLLLCSDGLSDNDLLEKHAKTYLEPLLSSHFNLDQGVNQLIELANQYNGHDNITAIAIRAKVRPNLGHLR
jgi:protein phosphatase